MGSAHSAVITVELKEMELSVIQIHVLINTNLKKMDSVNDAQMEPLLAEMEKNVKMNKLIVKRMKDRSLMDLVKNVLMGILSVLMVVNVLLKTKAYLLDVIQTNKSRTKMDNVRIAQIT